MIALRVWAGKWTGHRLRILCDNMNSCIALQTGRSRDRYMQACVRSVFVLSVTNDVELDVCHKPGADMTVADALSRAPVDLFYMHKYDECIE